MLKQVKVKGIKAMIFRRVREMEEVEGITGGILVTEGMLMVVIIEERGLTCKSVGGFSVNMVVLYLQMSLLSETYKSFPYMLVVDLPAA